MSELREMSGLTCVGTFVLLRDDNGHHWVVSPDAPGPPIGDHMSTLVGPGAEVAIVSQDVGDGSLVVDVPVLRVLPEVTDTAPLVARPVPPELLQILPTASA